MAELILDPFGLESDESAYVITRAEQFPEVRLKVRESMRASRPYRMIVRQASLWDWFADIRLDPTVAVRRRDPVGELREKLNLVALPQWLVAEPRLIVEWKLLEQAGSKHVNQSVDDWVRVVRLGSLWGKKMLLPDDVPVLLREIHELSWTELHPRLQTLIREKVTDWSQDSHLGPFLKWLNQGNLQEYARAFDYAQRVVGYPHERVSTWLGACGLTELARLQDWSGWASRLAPSLIPNEAVPQQINAAVRRYIIDYVAGQPEALETVAKQMSGRIPGERSALTHLLTSWEGPITRDTVFALMQSFHGDQLVATAAEYVEVPEPLPLPEDGAPEEVLQWVRHQYTPFSRWTRAVGKPELTGPHAATFERWFFTKATQLDPIQYSVYGLVDYVETLAEPAVLIVLIDGMGLEWVPDLMQELKKSNLHPVKPVHSRFTILPSITEYAKPALIRGQEPRQMQGYAANTEGYRTLLSARLHGKNVQVINEADRATDLVELVAREVHAGSAPSYYLYLANQLDQILHRPATERQRRNRARSYLIDTCKRVREACDNYALVTNRKLTVVFAADHGHTILPPTGRALEIPEGGEVTHSRAVKLPAGTQTTLEGARYLDAETWGLAEPFLVAEGHNYFGNRPPGTVHGGMLPEEVVIPVVTVQPGLTVQDAITDPLIAVKGRVLRNRASSRVQIRIENPNEETVFVCQLVISHATGLPSIVEVPAHGSQEIEAVLDSRGLRSGLVRLDAKYSLRCQDREVGARSCVVPLEVRGAAAETSLDDLF